MENSHKLFQNVFKNIKFPSHIINIYKNTHVSHIKINKNTKKMTVQLDLKKIIDENTLCDLEEALLSQLDYIKKVEFNLSYKIKEMSLNQILQTFKKNILIAVKKKSPISFSALENSVWEIKDNKITIKLKNNFSFILKNKKIDELIINIIKNNFKLDVHLEFLYQENKRTNKYDYEIKIQKMIEHTMDNTSNTNPLTNNILKVTSNKSDFFKKTSHSKIKINTELKGNYANLSDALKKDTDILLFGRIFDINVRTTKNGRLLVSIDLTDTNDSISVKFFTNQEEYDNQLKNIIKKYNSIIVKGKIQYDEYLKELNVIAYEVCRADNTENIRTDNASQKRVELHLHTQMSSMDGINHVSEYIKRAQFFGHKAIAVTDHGVVQAFPDAKNYSKGTDVKIIYGVEAYLVDDMGAVIQNPRDNTLNDSFVVFDIETTGLSKETNNITEIGAVKIINGEIVNTYSTLVNPKEAIPEKITKLTGISDEMVKDAPFIEEVIPEFLNFIDNNILVAHNASFDIGFIITAAKRQNKEVWNTVVDTLELCRTLFKDLQKYKLNFIAEHLGIQLENHHRAVDDAVATAKIFLKCIEILKNNNINTLQQINILASENIDKSKLKYYHAIILVKNSIGLKNLYELISKSHLNYYFKKPRIPKSEFLKLKDGLIIGTACSSGEFYNAVYENKPDDFIRDLAEFYDFFEVQPIQNNMHLVRNGIVSSIDKLKEINKKIIDLGDKYKKPVIATGDVHFLEPSDSKFRSIIMAGEGFKDADQQPPLYFKTTEEMLDDFNYLSKEKAYEIVVTNTNKISDMIEKITPIPDDTYPPVIKGAEEELKRITMSQVTEIYGNKLPKIVSDRLEKELTSIIKNGFAVMYIIAQKLVWKSEEEGYLVGSRGSVGSSFVATMAGITEVNPLPPHYVCPHCKYSDFNSDLVKSFAGASGYDMPDKNCPVCYAKLNKNGHDIPFETFLGFEGEKEPDIDLNFSGEYQLKAHAYTEELFGADNVFKAGTIGTLADKTAYGYVLKYLEERGLTYRNAEINRLKKGCTGIKKTTGQHPGGLMVVPSNCNIYEFTPVQHPANDVKSSVITTHFDYHSISGRLLKLDLLGHDVPTIIRMLHDSTGVDPKTLDLGDKNIISLFTSPDILGLKKEYFDCNTGTLGLPEFGTSFVRQMLIDTKPTTFAELVRISGLSHGTDVWFNNAQELISNGTATLKEVIPTRDDIMVYLINNGIDKKHAFTIMENVRKGKGLKPDEIAIMKDAGIKDWYIESCNRIKYMFPKGHAVAYVMMTVRIGYFKIYYPYNFYAALFSVKAEDFDYEIMCHGIERAKETMKVIVSKGKEASAKDKSMITILELVCEMYARGLKFVSIDLYKANVNKFIVTEEGLMPPLCSLQGLGDSVAQNIINTRAEGEFHTIEDFKIRTKSNKTVMDILRKNNIFGNLSETDQLSLF